MAENYEYESILSAMLEKIPDSLDKREGSLLYYALAPTAFLIAQQNYMISYLTNLLFIDTAEEEWLDRCVNEFGVVREKASYALRQIDIYDQKNIAMEVPLNTRFAINEISFILTKEIAVGQYQAQCEQVGRQGNLYQGTILPIDHINGLGSAILVAEPLIPARDVEEDEVLRARFYDQVRQVPYGGNIADYEQKALEIEGVGAVKVFHALSQGAGNVGLVIGDEEENKATTELITKVQKLFGENGDGIAPIGHKVTVKTSSDLTVNTVASIKIKPGASFAIVKPVVEKTIKDYIENIAFTDATIFYAKLVATILNCHESILDVGVVTMNTKATNLSLTKTYESYQVPVIGTVTVSEVGA